MTQRERDRLVVLKKAKRKLITQAQAAEEIGVTERQIRRLLRALKQRGDRAVIHALKGKVSNRRMEHEKRDNVIRILSDDLYHGFGPTLASEYLRRRHGIDMGREALRLLMAEAGLWRARRRKAAKAHLWRQRRSRFGELIQWDTSDHDWLEGRGGSIHLIHMIDDATSRVMARFVASDSSEENMKLLWTWLERHGRPLAVYTDKDSMFHNAPKRVDGADLKQMQPTQIGRALAELGIAGIRAHSPQAKGRVERSFRTAQDRLVKGLRVERVRTLEAANEYLAREFLPWWEAHCTVRPAQPDDAHRPLGREHDLSAILSCVIERRVMNDYTFMLLRNRYRIEPADIVPGLRGGIVRIERRLDGSIAAAFQGRYLRFADCPAAVRQNAATPARVPAPTPMPRPKSTWMKNFHLKKSPPMQAAT